MYIRNYRLRLNQQGLRIKITKKPVISPAFSYLIALHIVD